LSHEFAKMAIERNPEAYIAESEDSGFWSVLFDAIGTDGDHVHLFLGSEPKNSQSKAMQIIRSIAAKQMFKSFPVSRKELWRGASFWSDGGYIGTVGEGITAEIIRNYILQQETSEEKEGYKSIIPLPTRLQLGDPFYHLIRSVLDQTLAAEHLPGLLKRHVGLRNYDIRG
jgi:hypothetical protein